jgi:hypothetical protein
MSSIAAVFELRRAMERGEPTLRVGVETLTFEQVGRRIEVLQGQTGRTEAEERARVEMIRTLGQWCAGEHAALAAARGTSVGA